MNKIQIIKPHSSYGWVTARVCGRWVQAKVYDTPSIYGINGGRISKLFVGKTSAWETGGVISFQTWITIMIEVLILTTYHKIYCTR